VRDRVLGGYVYAYFPCLPSQSFLLRSFLLVISSLVLPSYPHLCTRVYTVVYPRVHCCIHACTQRRSLLLRFGALFYSMDGLSFTLRMSSPRLARRARTSSTAGLPLLLPYPPINNVPACEGIGNLRCDLELWREMHYLCRRKSKRGGAQQTRRTRRKIRRESEGVCEKICGKVW